MVFDRELAGLLGLPKPANVSVENAPVPDSWATNIAAAQAAVPDGAIRAIAAPRKPGAPFTVRLQRPGDINPEGATRVRVDNGAVVDVADPATQGFAARALSSMLGIHMITYIGGFAGQLSLGLLGLALAGLVTFGALSWLRARQS